MHLGAVTRIFGRLLMAFSIFMLPPAGVAAYYGDGQTGNFLTSALVLFVMGLVIYLPLKDYKVNLRLRDGFLVVALFWVALGFAGAAPLLNAGVLNMSLVDAVFESIAGLTTTGATVLINLDYLPRSILYYRQQLQWLGGMGIIVLAVAVLPMLGVGGMQLYKAETPGPAKDNRIAPRISQTANRLWQIYLALTVACALAYWGAGMELFDAIGHSFSTVAIGGFSTHDASMGYFSGHLIHLIAVFFMFISGANFALHFYAWEKRSVSHYLLDPEFRAYLSLQAGLVVITILILVWGKEYDTLGDSIVHGLFQAVSISTTTGFTTTEYVHWPIGLPVLLLMSSFIGGCAGSTGGGMKVVRWLLIYKQGLREIFRLVHPNAEVPVKLGEKAVPVRIVEAVWGFFSVYIVLFAFMLIILMVTGLDQITAFAAVSATLNNLGPGLGDVAANFRGVNDVAKWVCIGAMLLGRLEIFTLFVLFTPTFWRR
jgi:trk system potassium uptake protein TrkH